MPEQTSIEWFLREMGKHIDTSNIPDEVIMQAYKIHKEEILKAYQHAQLPYFFGKWSPEEYYNETFNK